MKGRRGSGVGKRHSLNGESRAAAAAAGMFPILPLGHSGPWRSRGGCLICHTKANACLASEVLGRRRSSTSECQGLQRARGRTVPDDFGGHGRVGSTLRRSGCPAPLIWAQGIAPKGKSPKVCWSLRAAGTSGRVAKARPGSCFWQCQAGAGARPRCPGKRQDRSSIPGSFLPVSEGNIDLS